jgi:hypothetical protein
MSTLDQVGVAAVLALFASILTVMSRRSNRVSQQPVADRSESLEIIAARKERNTRLGWPDNEPHPFWAEVQWEEVQNAAAWYRKTFNISPHHDGTVDICPTMALVWKMLAAFVSPFKTRIAELEAEVATLRSRSE